MPTPIRPTLSNRDVRRALVEFGTTLDSQAQAISGLAENQRILHDAMKAFISRSWWARVKWLVRGV